MSHGLAMAQPLFFMGKTDAQLEGAFSFGYLRSPLDYPANRSEVETDFNLPVNIAGSAQHLFAESSDSTVVIPGILGRVSQLLNASLSASSPVGPGVLFFAARENAGLRVTASLGDANVNLDTVLAVGTLRLKGSIFLPIRFDIRWRSLSLGYVYQPSPWMRVGLQVHRHEILVVAGGDLRPDLVGRVEVEGAAFDIDYSKDRLFGNANGQYSGLAFTPEMAVEIGPVFGMIRMPTSLRAEGRLDMNYSVPFFIDPETFDNEITSPDSLLTSENLRRLQGGETRSRQWLFHEPLAFSLPGSITFGGKLWNHHLEISYTKMFGSLGVHGQPQRANTDSVELRSEGFLDAALTPDHLVLLRWTTSFFHGGLGAHTVNFAYRKHRQLLSGLSAFEIQGDPIAPLFQFGFLWGKPLSLNLEFSLVPIPSLQTGMRYLF